MILARSSPGFVFCILFIISYFTNKYVLSVLKFTYPTLFLGWQTCTGALLLLVTGKLGWVEINGFSRSAALLWLPGSIFFLGNIYAGSKALSMLPIPFFFVLQNVSEVVFFIINRVTQRERSSWIKIFSQILMLMSAFILLLHNPQFGPNGYIWASIHLFCIGSYRVFQKNSKSGLLSDFEQQLINYLVSIFLLASAAHPTGDVRALFSEGYAQTTFLTGSDLFGALEFPFLMSYKFHGGCFASAVFGFLLLLASVKLKSGQSLVQCAIWVLLAKMLASGLSIFIFSTDLSPLTVYSILTNHAGEALSIHSDRIQER